MKKYWGLAISLVLLAQVAAAQSLGDLARKERERRAQQEKAGIEVTTDHIKKGQVDLSPPLDPARKGDLDYLLQQLSHPRVSPELLAAFLPHRANAIPKLLPMLSSADALKRVGPATVLIVLGKSEGVVAVADLLVQASDAAAAEATAEGEGEEAAAGPPSDTAFRDRMESAREADYALRATTLGVWRFTEGSDLSAEQVVERLRKGPPIEVVGGPDNGQRIFSRAFRDNDENLRRGAGALMLVAGGDEDFGYQPDQPAEQNEAAIQRMTTFLTTERGRVIARIGTRGGRTN